MTKLIGIFSFFAFHTLNCMNISRVLPYTREPAKRYLLTQSTYNMVYFLFDEVKSHRRRRNSVSQSFLFNSKIRSQNFIICPLNRREAQRLFISLFQQLLHNHITKFIQIRCISTKRTTETRAFKRVQTHPKLVMLCGMKNI